MPQELSFSQRRVLGVLIEKGYTTPEQYPLSLNALVNGCNQKSCREPMTAFDEEQVLDALDSLREKGLATLVRSGGARVDKYRHQASGTFDLEAKSLAILAELLLRGPQSDGELRQRASRMRPIDSLDELRELIDALASGDDPFVRRLGPPGRRRGVKYAHCFYPPQEAPQEEDDDGEADAPSSLARAPAPGSGTSPRAPSPSPPPAADGSRLDELQERVVALERELEALKGTVERLMG